MPPPSSRGCSGLELDNASGEQDDEPAFAVEDAAIDALRAWSEAQLQ